MQRSGRWDEAETQPPPERGGQRPTSIASQIVFWQKTLVSIERGVMLA